MKEKAFSKLHVYFSVCVWGVGVGGCMCVFKYIYTLTEHLLYFALGLFPNHFHVPAPSAAPILKY